MFTAKKLTCGKEKLTCGKVEMQSLPKLHAARAWRGLGAGRVLERAGVAGLNGETSALLFECGAFDQPGAGRSARVQGTPRSGLRRREARRAA